MTQQPLGRKVPSLKDIALAANVSVMTVSNVLRPGDRGGRRLFSEETKVRVAEVARKLGYVPNRAARAMRTNKSGVVGFVAANFSKERGTVENFTVHPFLVGVNHVLTPTQRHVALVELDEVELHEGGMPLVLQEGFFDALLVHYGLTPQALDALEQLSIPLIYWDSGIFQPTNCIYRDEFAVAKAVTERFLALGHQRIGFFLGGGTDWDRYQAGEIVHYSLSHRYEGYAAALKGHKGSSVTLLRGYNPEEQARQIEKAKLTAIVTHRELLSHFRAAALLGKRVPEDLSLLSCDVETSVANRSGFGGALYNRYEAGRTAGRMIVERLESRESVPSVVLPVEVADDSTAARCSSR